MHGFIIVIPFAKWKQNQYNSEPYQVDARQTKTKMVGPEIKRSPLGSHIFFRIPLDKEKYNS
jgi:hypothetical protein